VNKLISRELKEGNGGVIVYKDAWVIGKVGFYDASKGYYLFFG
jgi:hypothetical protein